MRNFDQQRYEFLLQMHDDGMLTPAMEEELDRREALVTGAEEHADAVREEKLNER